MRTIVTGASGGIGRALAVELTRQGARLVITARREAQLQEVAGEIRSFGGEVEAVVGDVTQPDVRQALLDAAQARYGGLDLLVNNAGIGALGLFEHASEQLLRQIMEVNFFAPAELTRAALPLLKLGQRPMVVNVGSVLGYRAIPRMSEYCASKFALRGLSQALRAELSRHQIDVLLVSPGTTETDFFDHLVETRSETLWEKRPRVTPQQVAQRTVRAIRRGRRETIPSLPGRLLVWLDRLSPALLERILARYER